LLQELAKGNGLTPIKAVNRFIRKDESLLDLVMQEALNPTSPQGKNAAWTLEYMCRRKRRTVKPYIPTIISTIPELTDFRQQAILLHLLIRFKLDADTLGPILNFCIDSLRRIEEASYLPYYSMQIIAQVVKQEPELSREFQLAIEEAMPLYEKFYVKRMANITIAICEKAGKKTN